MEGLVRELAYLMELILVEDGILEEERVPGVEGKVSKLTD